MFTFVIVKCHSQILAFKGRGDFFESGISELSIPTSEEGLIYWMVRHVVFDVKRHHMNTPLKRPDYQQDRQQACNSTFSFSSSDLIFFTSLRAETVYLFV